MQPRIISISADGRRTKQRSWLGPHHHKVYPPDFCYLCETTGADSKEHVIARAFFGGTTDEIPKLRAHTRCNNQYGTAEEYVRNVLVQFDAATGTVWS
jgi:hypothetical protein